jgi:hypothetical protein
MVIRNRDVPEMSWCRAQTLDARHGAGPAHGSIPANFDVRFHVAPSFTDFRNVTVVEV